MKTPSASPPKGHSMSKATRSMAVVYAAFSFLLFVGIGIAAAAPNSVAPNRINIGSDDDPYYVEDTLALEAMKIAALAPSPASATSTVARLGSWSTGLTHTPGAGSNRLLIFAVGYEHNGDPGVNAVTYGGQSLTRIGGVVAGTSSRVRTELWYLKETGIAAAGSTTFVVTWGGSTPSSPKYGAATYANVNQTTPIGHSVGTSVNASTPNPITATLNVFGGGMAVSDVFCGNNGSYTWQNSYVEGFDQSGSSCNMSAADRTEPTTGSSIASATHSSPNRQVLFAASLVPDVAGSVFDSLNISQIDPSQFPHICTYVEALDQFGNPIGGLTADSFCVSQDNNPINSFTVQQFTIDSCRTATCLVIDVSGSMADNGKLTAAKNAAASFVRNMDIFDRAAIVKFSSCYTVVQNFTGDTTLLLNAITGLASEGWTAYFDGVWEGVMLTIPELGSKAIIHLTDGMENYSQNCGDGGTPDGLPDGFADDSTLIVNLALGAGIPLYGITLGGDFDPQYVQKLSYATGGAYYNAPTGAQLEAIYSQIKNRLCSRYLICYNSPDTLQNGDCHDVLICHHLSNGQCVDCDATNYCEKAPPVITRTPATITLDNTCQRWGTQVQLCAYVTDRDTPLNQLAVTLFYRNSNLSPYTSVSTSRTDSTFCASVPASQLVCGGDSIQYYFTASDGAVTVASPANAPNGHYAFPICPNYAPVCSAPRDTTIFQCTPTQVCLPVSATDQDNNLQGCAKTVGPGTLSGGQWCYTPTGSGMVSVTVRCTDSCGLYCEKSFNVTFNINTPPVCSVPRDTTIFQCTPAQVCLPVSATGNNPVCTIIGGPGILSGGSWCYAPTGDQAVTVTVRCTDACGATCEKTFHVTFDINDAPVCSVPRDTTIFQCTPTQVCLPVSATDANGNLTGCTITNGPGTLAGGNWCYTPTGDQAVSVTVRCTDACGAYCEKTFQVTFDINDAPVCSVPRDTTIFQCAPAQVCLPVSATDANGNLTGCTIVNGPGTLVSGLWCYMPSGDETANVTIRCTDACGVYCEKTFHVTFDINDAPVCSVPRDTTIFQCAPTQVCLPVSATDANGNLTGCTVINGPGALAGGNWCYTPTGDQAVSVTVRCTDACSAYCEKTFQVTFDINDAPVCSVPRDTTIFQCAPAQVYLPVSATDANGNLTGCTIVNGPGTITGGNWCYTPTGDQAVTVTVRCTDACGAYCEKTFHVTFDINDAPVCSVPRDTTIFQCAPAQVCLPVSATDANGNLTGCAIVNGPGTLSGGYWCYTPTGDQTATVTIRCSDACGAYCEKTFQVTFDINDAPVCSVPRDTTIFQCAPTQVYLPVSATDANGNLTGCTITNGPGTLAGGNWCYTPTGDQTVTVTIRCTDACGAYCEKTFHVTFDINDAPVCSVPRDTTIFQCAPAQVCLPVSATDANGNLTGCAVVNGPGTITGGNWCYTPTGDQAVSVTVRCTDACGAYCEKTFQVTFNINDLPTISLGDDISVPQSFPQVPVCITYTVSDPNGLPGLIESLVSAPGGTTIDTALNKICFTPGGLGTYTIIADVTDPCGARDVDTVVVSVFQTAPPMCNLPNDTALVQCTPAQLCLPVTSTSQYPPVTCVIVTGPGTLSGGQWCYTPTGDETAVVTISCTDALGVTCSGTFTVVFDINDPPVCGVPNDTTIFQCVPAQVCLPVSATDANGNLTECTVIDGPGTITGGNWCYTPSGDQAITATIRCTDACGAYCEKTFQVTFEINEAPVCTVPRDTTIFQCALTPVCLPVSATDADGNLVGCQIVSGPGQLNGNWCYTPTGSGPVSVTVRCTDACGATCEKTFTVTFDINDAPVCHLPRDTSIFQCAPLQVCLPVSATDADGNLVGCQIVGGPGLLQGGNWCYTPAGSGPVSVTIRCTDACEAFCEGTFQVTFTIGQPPQITCPSNLNVACVAQVPPCSPGDVTVIGGAGHVTVTCSSSDNGGSGCASSPLIYTYTYSATDSCGAIAQCQRTITVIDNVRPQLTGCPGNVTIECSDPVPPPATVTATDNCSQGATVTFSETPNLNGCGGYTGTIVRRWIATDHCGNADTCVQVITKVDTQAPVCNIPSGPFNFFLCAPTQISGPVSATDNCDPAVTCQVTAGLGAITNGNWVYTPTGNESFSVTVRCSDHCGNTCQGTFAINIQLNAPPALVFGADRSAFLCAPSQICESYTVSDPNSLRGAIELLVSGPPGATIDTLNNRVCFTPTSTGTYTLIAKIIDSCGVFDVDTININVTNNSAPTIAFGNNQTVSQCVPASICANYTVSDPDGLAGSTQTLVLGPSGATINPSAHMVCFTPSASGTYTIIARITDTCGIFAQDTINITVVQNSPPVCSVPNDTTILQCTPAQVCLPAGGSDPDGDPVTCQKTNGPGQLAGGNWCYTPTGSQTVYVTVRCIDACGTFCEKTFRVTFDINEAPVCSVPRDTTILQCSPRQVCLPVSAIDPDGGSVTCQKTNGPGQLVNGNWCYTPNGDQLVNVTILCTDACGASCEKGFSVAFRDTCAASSASCLMNISLGINDGTVQAWSGQQAIMPVMINSLASSIGGFDLMICYDASAVGFLTAHQGELLDSLKWEYFTYRHGAAGNCTGGCPSGIIHLVGIANMNNSVTPPSTAYRPIGEIASLVFNVSADLNLINQCVPINFCWFDCGDNLVSDSTGDTAFVEYHLWVDTCQTSHKTEPIPAICFSGGWICIIPPPDDRGDINLNGVPNEVGDAVLFSNYFIFGPNVLHDPAPPDYYDNRVLATDINDDGTPLSIADLVYLIRIITGDANPFPGSGEKVAPYATIADVGYTLGEKMVVTAHSMSDVGGAAFIFRHSGEVGAPVLSDELSNMTLKFSDHNGELRVLVFSMNHQAITSGAHELFTVPMGEGTMELSEVQFSDAQGNLMSVNSAKAYVPTVYELSQNYPNPFNVSTVIRFALPKASDWTLRIYNVAGQMVDEFKGHSEIGVQSLNWNPTNSASGIYFYKLVAGSFTDTKKMILMK